MEIIKILPIIIALLTAVVTLWSAAFLTGKLSPNIELTLNPVWSSSDNARLKLMIEVENKGLIRVGVEKVLLVVYQHEYENIKTDKVSLIGGEWIDFENAEKIMTTSYYINPKEKIHVARLYNIESGSVIHAGIQIYLMYPWYIQKLGLQARSTRQTRVYYFSKDIDY